MDVEAGVDNVHAPIEVHRPILGLATLTEDLVVGTTVSAIYGIQSHLPKILPHIALEAGW
jgi:hypothetical protein